MNDTSEKCKACNGSGRVKVDAPAPCDPQYEDCQACGGKGFIGDKSEPLSSERIIRIREISEGSCIDVSSLCSALHDALYDRDRLAAELAQSKENWRIERAANMAALGATDEEIRYSMVNEVAGRVRAELAEAKRLILRFLPPDSCQNHCNCPQCEAKSFLARETPPAE